MRKPEDNTFSGTGSVPSGSVCDPAKCSLLSIGEKRQLVHEIFQWSDDPVKALSSLTRKELLELICVELGKERKYSGFTKLQMIQHLLKLVASKSNLTNNSRHHASPLSQTEAKFKRQRKHEDPCQSPIQSGHVHSDIERGEANVLLCQNLACRAILSREDAFCKRCSCCICRQYDDNKDPSLWLTCDSDSLYEDKPCGMSCHLKCALEHEQSGLLKNGCCEKLDGNFFCVPCGKVNGLMRTWRKQLMVAKEARRVDVLCQRVSFSFKILEGTLKYKELLKIVKSAKKILENEVGPLYQASAEMDRKIVNRLSCGTAVQKLCTSALEAFDSMLTYQCVDHVNQEKPPAFQIRFEGPSPTGVTVVLEYEDCLLKELSECRLWHRKSTMKDFPDEATYVAPMPVKRFKLSSLDPSMEYVCKVSFLSKTTTLGNLEAKWTTPALTASSTSVSDEEKGEKGSASLGNVFMRTESMNSSESKAALSDHPPKLQTLNDIQNKSNEFPTMRLSRKHITSSAGPIVNAPSTPSKSDGVKELPRLGSKKQSVDNDYEFSVKIIRRLEHEGHMESNFRVKFLTWFSLKATMQERRVVSVFINTFSDDPPSLAGQLVDTFKDEICQEPRLAPQHGFCTRFWH